MLKEDNSAAKSVRPYRGYNRAGKYPLACGG
jgi:hypothetical protein